MKLFLALILNLTVMDSAFALNCRSIHEPAESIVKKPTQEARVKSIINPAESLAAKILLIRNAQRTIDLSYYAIQNDKSAHLVLSELLVAARRGIKIRIAYDEVGSGALAPFKPHFLHLINSAPPGKVEIKVINPVIYPMRIFQHWVRVVLGKTPAWTNALAFNNRSHDKIIMADAGTSDMVSIVGGRNIGDQYYGLNPQNKINYLDFETIVRSYNPDRLSQAEVDLKQHFENLYAFRFTRFIELGFLSKNLPYSVSKQQDKYEAGERVLEETPVGDVLRRIEKENYFKNGFHDAQTKFVHDLQNLTENGRAFSWKWWTLPKTVNEKSMVRSFRENMLKTKTNFEIVSPYIFFTKKDVAFVTKWLYANPQASLHIYTNSIMTSDSPIPTAVFNYIVAPRLLALKQDPRIGDRIHIRVFLGAKQGDLTMNSIHMKGITSGDEVSGVGTSNFDIRSANQNSEMGLWIKSEQYQKDVRSQIDLIKDHSIEWQTQYDVLTDRPGFATKVWTEAVIQYLDRILRLHLLS
ncbi:MAG: phospholipase D-like domain-containing protein [Pseudobdellovibrionaceae bacterium]